MTIFIFFRHLKIPKGKSHYQWSPGMYQSTDLYENFQFFAPFVETKCVLFFMNDESCNFWSVWRVSLSLRNWVCSFSYGWWKLSFSVRLKSFSRSWILDAFVFLWSIKTLIFDSFEVFSRSVATRNWTVVASFSLICSNVSDRARFQIRISFHRYTIMVECWLLLLRSRWRYPLWFVGLYIRA